VLQVAGQCIHDCARCELQQRRLRLEGVHDDFYPVRTDLQGRSRIYDYRPFDAVPELPTLLEAGMRRFMVDGTLLDAREIGAAVERLRDAVTRAQTGKPALGRLPGHSAGHLHNPID
jgi:putative protease